MKKYFKKFIKEEDGIETIEFIGLVAVAAILIGIVATIGGSMKQTAEDAKSSLDAELGKLKGEMGGTGAAGG